MATSKCGHCNGTTWEMKIVEAKGGNYKQNFIQCASCGVPVGVLDYYNLGAELKDRQSELARLQQLVTQLGSDVFSALERLEGLIRTK